MSYIQSHSKAFNQYMSDMQQLVIINSSSISSKVKLELSRAANSNKIHVFFSSLLLHQHGAP